MSGNINFNGWINDDGSENYKCRAWVNFNGTGTVAIRASGNVSSITDNGTGDYTVNFATAMPDTNYSMASLNGYSLTDGSPFTSAMTELSRVSGSMTSTFSRVRTGRGSDNSVQDHELICISFFR